jgi:hypothetical protein
MTEYYKTKYGKDLDPNQPILEVRQSGGKQSIVHLPPQFCFMTGIPEENRQDLQKTLQSHEMKPSQMKVFIFILFYFNKTMLFCIFKSLIDQVVTTTLGGERERKELQEWGVTVGKDMIQIPARRCPVPTLFFGRDERVRPNEEKGGLLLFFFYLFMCFEFLICLTFR